MISFLPLLTVISNLYCQTACLYLSLAACVSVCLQHLAVIFSLLGNDSFRSRLTFYHRCIKTQKLKKLGMDVDEMFLDRWGMAQGPVGEVLI